MKNSRIFSSSFACQGHPQLDSGLTPSGARDQTQIGFVRQMLHRPYWRWRICSFRSVAGLEPMPEKSPPLALLWVAVPLSAGGWWAESPGWSCAPACSDLPPSLTPQSCLRAASPLLRRLRNVKWGRRFLFAPLSSQGQFWAGRGEWREGRWGVDGKALEVR